mmetsp:Transcript_57152/g.66810  ORF Transcript_57152/g.66810 Transcript_57152/m.66810 type:complete len:308 (-) Transcript_57152:50-973(-)|eukprot:CAMPEP_0194369384 /NCGR_PEP_ID=MMETSP0174-20130528/17676_1 /TAXON_ID=216777 /ORGANISM="Proboscia alata, Strain PI-D3" /LENGTH=307 /DNA_ID=CAMNT_0039146291 /DNA_START=35 /DNA_END=958 /DNA_ORIENTATION=-
MKIQSKAKKDEKELKADDDGSNSNESNQIINSALSNIEECDTAKNRKTDENDEEEDNDDIEGDNNSHENNQDDEKDDDKDTDRDNSYSRKPSKSKRKKKVHKLKMSEVENFNAKLAKRGVIYIARIPPQMNPAKVKSLLSEFGEVTRVFLVEEDASIKKKRKRNGGGWGKRFTEGWIEYASKSVAKRVAQDLNTTPITNDKRSVHADDLWNLKYLRKFQWSHLTEKVAYERRVREQRLKMDMMQAKRENAAFVGLVEKGKRFDYIEERIRKKEGKNVDNLQVEVRQKKIGKTRDGGLSATAFAGSLM